MIIAGKAHRFHGFYYVFHLGHFNCQKRRTNEKLNHLLRHLPTLRRLLDKFFCNAYSVFSRKYQNMPSQRVQKWSS